MIKSVCFKLGVVFSVAVLTSVGFAQDQVLTTETVIHEKLPVIYMRYFDVRSTGKSLNDADCQALFDVKMHKIELDTPVLKISDKILLTNRFYSEYAVENGFVFGYGTTEFTVKTDGDTIKTVQKYQTVRLVNDTENMGIFSNDYCKGFFRSSWVKVN